MRLLVTGRQGQVACISMPQRDYKCEHEGCYTWGGWGFGKPKGEPHWFCFEHRAEGERYL